MNEMANVLPETLRDLAVPLASLRPYPNNPRQGDIGAIAESLKAHNQYRPVVVRRQDNTVLAGNHTLQAAKALGWEQIAATFVDVDDDEAARIVLVDNRTSDLATNAPEKLAALLQELQATPAALAGTGYDGDALDALLADLGQTAPALQGDPDDVPEAAEEPVSQRADLWVLGRHRLLCGDSTVSSDVERLMDGAQADLVWTDPPYGVNVAGRTKDPRNKWYRTGPTIENDNLSEPALEALLRAAFEVAWALCREGAPWYVAAPARPLQQIFGRVLGDLGLWRQGLVWVKNSFVFGRSDYHYRHEPIFYGWKEGASHHFVDDRTQDSVWEIDRPAASPEHPTMKPVELVARAIRNSSKRGDIVLDPFGGSGTTLIACEQEGRRARLIDIDPRYVDVTVRRWENLTGRKAELCRERISTSA